MQTGQTWPPQENHGDPTPNPAACGGRIAGFMVAKTW
jgi:hypothetical protein